MTIPTTMNCSHDGDGWCLQCVGELAAERDKFNALSTQLAKALLPLAHWEGCWDRKGNFKCVCGKSAAMDLAEAAGVIPKKKESDR